jgi:hypothetical protein
MIACAAMLSTWLVAGSRCSSSSSRSSALRDLPV